MGTHYFTNSEDLRHEERTLTLEQAGRLFSFQTDAGVFSKEHLDPGSELLIESVGALAGSVCDLGCGWGPIGTLLAARNPKAAFVLVDVNERAVELAQRNLQANGISNARAQVSDGLHALAGQQFQAIVTNPPIRIGKQAMYDLFRQAHRALTDGGELYLVIRKQQGAPSAKTFLTQLFGNCQTIAHSGGYWILYCRK